MKAAFECDRRAFLLWGIGAWVLLTIRQTSAAETAVALLQIDGMT